MASPFGPAGLNLHHDAEIDALADRLADDREDGPAATLVSGEAGEGRRYFVARVAERLREKGVRALYAQIDLDGYEPERADPVAYARHAAAKRGAELDPADEGWIRRSMRGPRPSLHDFLAAAILVGRDDASENLRERLTDAFAATDPWAALAESLAADERLALHVVDTAELPSVAREWLLELSTRHPRLKTVISCLPDDGLGKLVRARPNLRFEVMPLDPGELRSLLEERLTAPGLPDRFYDELWEQTGGVRGLVAQAVERRLRDGAFDPSAAAPSVDPATLLEEAAAGLDADDGKRLTSFVSLAALCGDNIPVREVLDYLGVEEDVLDDWIDRLDETVGADSDHALFAERFQHPSLPGRTVYGFASGAFALRLRKSFSVEARTRLALELMKFLGQRFPVGSRAAARFYVELSRWAQQNEQRLELERELAWWAGPDELGALRSIVAAELAAGQRTPLAIWTTVNTVQFGWPPARTLALLQTIPVKGLPPHLHAAHAALCSGLLLQAERPAEALAAAEAGVKLTTQDRLLESALWERMGRAYLAMGRQEEAKAPFARCGELQEQLLDEGDARVTPWIKAYARTLREAGHEQQAVRLEQKLARL